MDILRNIQARDDPRTCSMHDVREPARDHEDSRFCPRFIAATGLIGAAA